MTDHVNTRQVALKIAQRFVGAMDSKYLADAIDAALQHREQEVRAAERERVVRVLGPEQIADLAHHAIGIWQAFEESRLFNNSAESGQTIHAAVEDARDIASIAHRVRRRDDTPQKEEGS